MPKTVGKIKSYRGMKMKSIKTFCLITEVRKQKVFILLFNKKKSNLGLRYFFVLYCNFLHLFGGGEQSGK